MTEHLVTVQTHETTKTQLERKEAELNKQLSECRVEIIELQEANVSGGLGFLIDANNLKLFNL